MDGAYLHLLVNHFPIVLGVVGAAAALLALVARRRTPWLYAVATLTIAGATAYPVMLTGHAAEDASRDQWYVARETVHAHEEASDVATYVLIAMGIASAVAWWRLARGRDLLTPPPWLQALVVLTALAGAGSVTWASYQGGKIVHKSERLATPPAGWVKPTEPPGEH
jgi:hypothetical protein